MQVKEIISSTQWVPSRRYGQDKPLVSVLLPTFRRGASGLFLKAARSVLNQSLSELELIIVDDASTDGTADQIGRLMAEDDRISCLRHPENVGLPAISEYEAFLKARADYLAFAFDDDEFYPDALRDLLSYSVKNDSSIIHGYVDMVYFDQSTQKNLKISGFGRGGMSQSMLIGANYLSNNAVLLHRRVVERVGFYDPHVAISRVCDWDLWRRISRCFEIVAVDVSVGQVLGPSTNDSLGHTYPMEHWQIMEWMNLPRDNRLIPAIFDEYDVLALPDLLSGETRSAIEEIKENFKNKFWYPKPSGKPFFLPGAVNATDALEKEGHLLVVTMLHDACTTLYFDHLPQFFHQRVRVVYPGYWFPEEMIGASAVVFVRHLFPFIEWIEYARKLKIPHYYFLDDNLMVLRNEPAYSNDYSFFTEKQVHHHLKSFSGVLLSTYNLIDYFKENKLHENLLYYPPVFNKPLLYERPFTGPKREKVFRIAYFGGNHRNEPFEKMVFPAIREFAEHHPVELIIGGDHSFESSENLKISSFPFEVSYDLALGRFAACEIDALVHPNSRTSNNPYKTQNVLINAVAMNAVPILSETPPYDTLGSEQVALLCGEDKNSWLEALRIAHERPGKIRTIQDNLEQFCQKHFNGQANTRALGKILGESPASGFVLRDVRYRQFIETLRHQVGKQAEEYQVDEGTGSFSIVFPSGQPKSHVRVFNKITYPVIPKRNYWAGIEVLVGTHQRPAQGRINLRVRTKSGQLLRETTVDLAKVRDNDWVKFRFSPIDVSASIPFTLEFRLLSRGPQTLISFFESGLFENKFYLFLRRLGLRQKGNNLYYRIWYGTEKIG